MKFYNVKNSIKDILGEDIKTIQIILRGMSLFMSEKRSHLEIPFNFSSLIYFLTINLWD